MSTTIAVWPISNRGDGWRYLIVAFTVNGGPLSFGFEMRVVRAVTQHDPDLPTVMDVRAAFNVQFLLTRIPPFLRVSPNVFAAAVNPSEDTLILPRAFHCRVGLAVVVKRF